MVQAWQVSRLLWGMVGMELVVVGMAVAEAQDGHPQLAAAPPVDAIEIAPRPSPATVPPMPMPTPADRTAEETIIISKAIESDEERFEDPFAMVSVPQRTGFERLRRLQPYGIWKSLMVGYLTEDERTAPKNDP